MAGRQPRWENSMTATPITAHPSTAKLHSSKPTLSFWQIWNMCFGFLGIQFGFALQNANVSRIFQTLGAEMDEIPMLWIAAPLTGLIVQPIVGYYSDRTWNRLGRRRPYFLIGALATSVALIFLPNSPTLWMAAGMLWILDASINISMEPFRAFVGDQLSPKQRPRGYAMQSFFIGIGAIVASLLPWMLTKFGFANTSARLCCWLQWVGPSSARASIRLISLPRSMMRSQSRLCASAARHR